MTMEYHKSTIRKLSGKANYYVVITKPKAIAKRYKEVERRSTGTSDKKLAEKLQYKITKEIYAEWDKLLQRDPFFEIVEKYWDDSIVGHTIEECKVSGEAIVSGEKVAVVKSLMLNNLITIGVLNELFEQLNIEEARKVRFASDFLSEESVNPYPINIQQRDINEGLAKKRIKRDSEAVLNKTGCPTILDLLPSYMNDIKWDNVSKKERKYAPNYIRYVVGIIGDKPVDQVISNDAIVLGETLHDEGMSTSTIKNYKAHLSNIMTYARDKVVNDSLTPPTPWITLNPILHVSMKDYGLGKRSWEALEEDQLFKLFKLKMSALDRLLLTILITTGMRLDEAALLTWEQYKTDKDGLRYFDLSEGTIVKNDKFSARNVAIPDCLKMPRMGKGKLFNFRTNADGKSSQHASRHLNEKYLHKIRYDKADDRKVVHSLRHNLTGLMQNLSPQPASEEMDWVTGHAMEGGLTQSERNKTYKQDISVAKKYDIVNRIKHPWLN